MCNCCQAQQALIQLKLSFVLFSLSPATQPTTHPPTKRATKESIRKTTYSNLYKTKVVSLHELNPKIIFDPKNNHRDQ